MFSEEDNVDGFNHYPTVRKLHPISIYLYSCLSYIVDISTDFKHSKTGLYLSM